MAPHYKYAQTLKRAAYVAYAEPKTMSKNQAGQSFFIRELSADEGLRPCPFSLAKEAEYIELQFQRIGIHFAFVPD